MANNYFKKFVTCSDIEADENLKIIDENESVIIKHNGEVVGGIIRDAATIPAQIHFGHKIKGTIEAHYKFKHGQINHAHDGDMAGHGFCAEGNNPNVYDTYAYKNKNLDPHIQKLFDEDRDSLAKWLYEFAKINLP